MTWLKLLKRIWPFIYAIAEAVCKLTDMVENIKAALRDRDEEDD